ncbi:hypothetical protein [Polaribacter sp.]|uniref:hypothetical protein n=1 Tax=Polaribacter sp. TaxID=1920175 RepID=UPI003F6D53A6
MKTNVLLVFVLIVNLSYAQKENLLKNNFFKINVEENHYAPEQIFPSSFFEIKETEKVLVTNNSEGKFPLYNINKATTNTNLNRKEPSFMLIREYVKFVNNIVQKKSEEINKVYVISQNEIYNTENYDVYRLPELIDVLNASYKISPNVDVQFGKNLEPYLKKINKTALDKTLQNSLNLLVVNF